MALYKQIKNLIYGSATAKTATSVALATLLGIFSNTFVAEITRDGKIRWAESPQTLSFWLMTACVVGTFFFHRGLYGQFKEIEEFRDGEFCIAYARSELIPAQIAAAKAAIAAGDVGRFEAAMKQIKGVVK